MRSPFPKIVNTNVKYSWNRGKVYIMKGLKNTYNELCDLFDLSNTKYTKFVKMVIIILKCLNVQIYPYFDQI